MGRNSDGLLSGVFEMIVKIFVAVLCLVTLVLFTSTLEFLFYLSIFGAILYASALMGEFAHGLVVAVAVAGFLYNIELFRRIEVWLVHNNVSRTLFLAAQVAAGVLVGRMMGGVARDLFSLRTPYATMEIWGAVILGLLNYRYFLARYDIGIDRCLSFRTFVVKR